MRLLVTGGAGFIGSNFVRYWRERHPEDDIAVMDKLTYAGSKENLRSGSPLFPVEGGPGIMDSVWSRISFFPYDICDPDQVKPLIGGHDVIVHLAAETHVDRSIQGAAEFVRTNVEGTYNMLNAAKEHGVEKFIHVSTDEVYGEVLEGAATEDWPFKPSSPYAASKAAGDCMAQAFHRTYGLPVVIVRPCNVFGPYQYPEKLIPFFVTRAVRGETLPLYGDGEQRRQWLHVDDLCRALEVLIEHGTPGEAYNVTNQTCELPNKLFPEAIFDALSAGKVRADNVADRPGHDRRYAMSDCKFCDLYRAHIRNAPMWYCHDSEHRYQEQLMETIRWYADNQSWCERRLEESKEYFEAQYGGAI